MVLATVARIQIWSGPEHGLWMEAIAHSPTKPRPWINLGTAYGRIGADDLARDAYQHARLLATDPLRVRWEGAMRGGDLATVNLALLHAKQGRYREALSLITPIRQRDRHHSVLNVLEASWIVAQAQPFSGY